MQLLSRDCLLALQHVQSTAELSENHCTAPTQKIVGHPTPGNIKCYLMENHPTLAIKLWQHHQFGDAIHHKVIHLAQDRKCGYPRFSHPSGREQCCSLGEIPSGGQRDVAVAIDLFVGEEMCVATPDSVFKDRHTPVATHVDPVTKELKVRHKVHHQRESHRRACCRGPPSAGGNQIASEEEACLHMGPKQKETPCPLQT